MKRFTQGARHLQTPSEKRWKLDQRERLTAALRQYTLRFRSMEAASTSLGRGKNAVYRVLGCGQNITPEIAEALAKALGTTADDIANGVWTPEQQRGAA